MTEAHFSPGAQATFFDVACSKGRPDFAGAFRSLWLESEENVNLSGLTDDLNFLQELTPLMKKLNMEGVHHQDEQLQTKKPLKERIKR